MKIVAIIIIGITILSISGIYLIQFTQNQQISEILTINDNEGNCDESIDKNRNKIPDKFETTPHEVISKITYLIQGKFLEYEDIDFSYCIFPNDIINYKFLNSNFSHVDFSNIEIKNTIFSSSILDKSNFSNSDLHGVIFLQSSINKSNFTNANFYPNPWENPYIVFTNNENKKSDVTCYFRPCDVVQIECEDCKSVDYEIFTKKDSTALNLKLADRINDESDRRDIYRHISGFYTSALIDSTFKNADLSYTVFHITDLSNTVIESANISNTVFDNTIVHNTKINEKYYKERSKLNEIKLDDDNFKQIMYDKLNKKIQNSDYKIEVDLIHVMDNIPINWSMGMTTFEQNLYVADTDNHRISVYDSNTFEKKLEFKSPLSHYCKTTNNWTVSNPDCLYTMKNLPTSIAILNEKIFVSYGFQDDIQIFDLDGKFLSKFGSSGNQKGEFSMPMHISASNYLLYIADSGNKRIQVVDSEGQFVNEFRVPVSNEQDLEISLDIFENKIYVINNKNADLFIYDLNGNLIKKITLEYDTDNSSIGVENGSILVSNANENKITIFDLDGVVMHEFGNYGQRYGEFDSPRGITVNEGKIYVSDPYNYRIQVFSMELK